MTDVACSKKLRSVYNTELTGLSKMAFIIMLKAKTGPKEVKVQF